MNNIQSATSWTVGLRLIPGIFNNLTEKQKQELLLEIQMQMVYLSTLYNSSKAGHQYFNNILSKYPDFEIWFDKL